MSKAKQRIASIITTISVTGTLMASFPLTTSAAVVNENNDNKATNVDISLEDAANYAKDVAIAKNAADYGLCDNVKDGVILHAFCWSFKTIKENMKDIAEAGYTTVQTSPANACNDSHPQLKLWSDDNGTGGCWWWHYQPTDWTIGNYQLGTRDDYKAMCDEADKYGVKIITDVLPNHTTPDLPRVSDNLANAAGGKTTGALYHTTGFQEIGDYNNRFECTLGQMGGLPDVNTENQGFQAYYLKYCNDLISIGCDGFRYDTAKHIGVPSDPKDSSNSRGVNDFWDVATGKKSVNGVTLSNASNLFIYGEVLQDRNIPYSEYASYMNMTASSYGDTLRGAIGSKDFSVGRISNWNHATPDKLVTWVESHDTYCNSHPSAWMTDWDIRMCWAIVAARSNGTPLFFSRPDGSNGSSGNYWGNNVLGAKGNDQFKDPEVAAVNKFRNAMVGESEYLRNPNGNSKILQIDRGKKGTVIINLGGSTSINNETTMADGTYTDQVSGRTFTVSGGKISGQLDGGKIAVIYDAKTTKNPKVSVTPGSGSFKGESVTLTLGLSNATSGTYTTSEGDSGSFKNGDKITVGSSISVGEKVTVTLKANGDDPESTPANETFTYTKKDGSVKKNTVYFTAPSGWSSPTIYAYTGDGTTATKLTGEWPGTAMTSEGDGVYSYTFADSVSSCKVIFASGTNQLPASQQPGFDYVGGKAYEYVSSWVEVPVSDTPVEKGTVTVKYVDEDGNDLTSPITLTGNVGDSYTTSKKTFSGYTLSSTPTNASGKYTKSGITVTYKYTKDEDPIEEGKVIVNYVDSDGNKLSSVTLTGNVGDAYETTEKTFSGYELVSIPSNASGTFKSTTITVTYRYEKIAVADGKVVVKYIDEQTQNEIATSTTLTGKIGESYSTSPKTISGYTLSFAPSNASGTYSASTKTVTYYYTKIPTSDLKVNSFTTDKASPQATGTKVTLKATASGTGLQYKFLIRDAQGNYFVIKNYSTSNTATWTTGATGNKTLYVDVKDSTGKVVRKEMAYTVKSALTVSSFTADKKSPQATGTKVTLKATASGTGLQYKFLIRDAQGNYFVIKNYSTSNTATWTTGATGNKTLYVDVKDSTGKVVRKEMAYSVTNPLTVSSFTVDKASPQATGTKVTLKATASGTGLQYKFLIRDDKGNYFIIKDYSTSNTTTWTTGATGNKTLYVDVKDSTGKVVRKEMAYIVKSARIEENNTGISYTGAWETTTGTNYSSGSCKYAQKAAAATYKFTGTGIKVIGNKVPTSGIVKITIDESSYYVDLYNASATYQNVIFTKTGLTSGTHTIKIEWTGLKNSASKGTTVNLDAFEVIK